MLEKIEGPKLILLCYADSKSESKKLSCDIFCTVLMCGYIPFHFAFLVLAF